MARAHNPVQNVLVACVLIFIALFGSLISGHSYLARGHQQQQQQQQQQHQNYVIQQQPRLDDVACTSCQGDVGKFERSLVAKDAQLHDCSRVSLDRPRYALRKKLLIIVSETRDRQGRKDTAHVVDNFKQYCARHDYLFLLHHYETDPELGVFGTRWREAFKYWHMADWLLMIDSDTLVGNLNNPMDPFLDGPEHVLLHWRPNREVTAAAVAIRTTEFGACFLKRWLSVIQTQMMMGRAVNADNGALLLLVAEFLEPKVAQNCAAATESFDLIRCYEEVNKHFHMAPSPGLPIKIFPLLAGFWRQHEGVLQQAPQLDPSCYSQRAVEDMMFKRCWSNDILMSGWKQIGAEMWPDIGSKRDTAKCAFNDKEQEVAFATQCCIHQFPGCIAANGTNVCKSNPACSNAGSALIQARADIGFGICKFVFYDTAWALAPGITECRSVV